MCSLLEDYRQIYQDVPFRDSKLVVDSKNLSHLLYEMFILDQNHGGEYLGFFKDLSDCGIEPCVVMDGGSATNNIKLVTLKDRVKGKVWSTGRF